MTELEFMRRVLTAFSFDENDSLLWHPDNTGRIVFSAQVSDQFEWGTADAEYITEENLPVLEQARADLVAIDWRNLSDLPVLFAARVRGMRPQGAALKYTSPAVRALYETLPARKTDIFNPHKWPGEE